MLQNIFFYISKIEKIEKIAKGDFTKPDKILVMERKRKCFKHFYFKK